MEHSKWHEQWLAQAQQNVHFAENTPTQQTHVLILSESTTSYNFGVCGYPRNTTPEIQARSNQLTVFCDAYSPYPSTINALKAMLTDVPPNQPDYQPKESLLADAKVAGFKVFWISNQDDAYLSSLFGSFANEAVYNNKRSGRSSFSKDEEVLPYFQDALNDSTPKKLIILHLIGSHPNYSSRYPDKFTYFPNQETATANQAIDKQMQEHNIGFWVRQQRDEYDNSIRYQDWMFAHIFDLLQRDNAPVRSLVFISDHGNEVGHEKDYAGHSPKTVAGYRVPLIIWAPHVYAPKIDQTTPIDASQLDDNMLKIMGLNRKSSNVILWNDSRYLFQVPKQYWQK